MLYILSQIAAFLVLCVVFVGFMCRRKAWLIFCVAMANVFLTLSYAFLSKWMPVAILSVATIRTFVFLLLERKRGKIPTWLNVGCLVFFLSAILIATILTWEIWFEFALMAGVMLFTYGVWAKGEHKVRVAVVIVSIIAIIYNVLVANWTAISVDVATLISVVVYYTRKWYTLQGRQSNVHTILSDR